MSGQIQNTKNKIKIKQQPIPLKTQKAHKKKQAQPKKKMDKNTHMDQNLKTETH